MPCLFLVSNPFIKPAQGDLHRWTHHLFPYGSKQHIFLNCEVLCVTPLSFHATYTYYMHHSKAETLNLVLLSPMTFDNVQRHFRHHNPVWLCWGKCASVTQGVQVGHTATHSLHPFLSSAIWNYLASNITNLRLEHCLSGKCLSCHLHVYHKKRSYGNCRTT